MHCGNPSEDAEKMKKTVRIAVRCEPKGQGNDQRYIDIPGNDKGMKKIDERSPF